MRTTIEILVSDLENDELKKLTNECIEELGSRIEHIPKPEPKVYESIKEIGSRIEDIPKPKSKIKSKSKKKAKLKRGRWSKKEEAEFERLKDDFPAERIAKRMERSLESVKEKLLSTEKPKNGKQKITTPKQQKKFEEVLYCVLCNQNAVTKQNEMCSECESQGSSSNNS